VPEEWLQTAAAGANPCVCVHCSGGLGQIDHIHLEKKDPEIGMLVVKIGGPAYRIGMGGGAASSVPSGSRGGDLDFDAVQVELS
jgi:phosphoribosylformylglycinamidine (FGAM) synthase-like enzyme